MYSNINRLDEGIIRNSENIVPDLYKVSIEKGIANQEKLIDDYAKTIRKNDAKIEIGEVIKNIDTKILNCSKARQKLIHLYKRLRVSAEVANITPTEFAFYNPDPESLIKLPNDIEKYQRIANLAKYILDGNFMFESDKDEPVNFIPSDLNDTKVMISSYKCFGFWQIFVYLVKQFEMPMINLHMFNSAELVYKYEITNLFDPPKPPPQILQPTTTTNKSITSPTNKPISTATNRPTISGGFPPNTNTNSGKEPEFGKESGKEGENRKEIRPYLNKEDYTKLLKKIQFQYKGKYDNLFKFANDNIKEYIKLTFSEFSFPYRSETRDHDKRPLRYNKDENKAQRRLIYKLKDDKTRGNLFVSDDIITKIERRPIRILESVFDIFNKEIEYKYEDLMKMLTTASPTDSYQKEKIAGQIGSYFNEIKRSMSDLLKKDKDYKEGRSAEECAILEYDSRRPLTNSLADYSLTELREIAEKITATDDKILRFDGVQISDIDVELLKSLFEIANAVIAGYFVSPGKKLRALFSEKIPGKEKERIFIGSEQIFDKFKPKVELFQYELINMYLKKYDILFVNFLHLFRYKGGRDIFDQIRERIYKFMIGYYSIYQDKLVGYIRRLSSKYELPIPTINSALSKQNRFVPMKEPSRMTVAEMLAALPERYTEQIREMERNAVQKYPRDSDERRDLVRKLEDLVRKTYDNYLEEMKPVAEYRPNVGNSASANRNLDVNRNTSKSKNLNKKLRNVFNN